MNNDLISRQAAIDALKQQADTMSRWSERYAEQRKGVLTAVNIVEDLPTIQPEIIYCKDCSKHNVSISKAPYPFKEYICPLIVFRGKAQGHEFDYQFCAYGKRREVTT